MSANFMPDRVHSGQEIRGRGERGVCAFWYEKRRRKRRRRRRSASCPHTHTQFELCDRGRKKVQTCVRFPVKIYVTAKSLCVLPELICKASGEIVRVPKNFCSELVQPKSRKVSYKASVRTQLRKGKERRGKKSSSAGVSSSSLPSPQFPPLWPSPARERKGERGGKKGKIPPPSI